MLGRFLLMGMCASMGTVALAAPPILPEGDAPDERLRLTCTGTTMAADQSPPGSRVIATGLIDFTARRVHGFGLGSQPILVLTASEIDFGSTPPERSRGVIIEGSIDRQSGDVRILVHESQRSVEVLIELRLDCEFEQPIS